MTILLPAFTQNRNFLRDASVVQNLMAGRSYADEARRIGVSTTRTKEIAREQLRHLGRCLTQREREWLRARYGTYNYSCLTALRLEKDTWSRVLTLLVEGVHAQRAEVELRAE